MTISKASLALCLVAITTFLGSSRLLSSAQETELLHYLPPDHLEVTNLLAPPPLPGSAEQIADLASVLAVHKACNSNEIALAFSEKKFSVFNFAPAIGSFLRPGKLPKTEAFFKNVQSDAALETDTAKEYWRRPRPYVVEPSLAAGKLDKSFSYPSGHSTESMVLALVLLEIFPDKSEPVLAIARNIGWHRVEIARHYPTDIYAGRVFAMDLARQMKANPQFQSDLSEVKRELSEAAKPGLTQSTASK
jgi:acid phosphatase (class A)